MIEIFNTKEGYIKSWVTDIESSALEQATTLANLPYVFKHVALMPDCHKGYGMPIGGVLATKHVVIPNAVGVDIGCGMRVVQTNLKASKVNLQEIVKKVSEVIPTGFNINKEIDETWWDLDITQDVNLPINIYERAGKSLGTLGGGNHFIEFQTDSKDVLYFMIHCGSRNLGKQVCDLYNNLAEKNCKANYSYYEKDLAFIPSCSPLYLKYLSMMESCVHYAVINRQIIAEKILNILKTYNVEVLWAHDIAHNYANYEKHFGELVMVHRKGATSARKDQVGIIPGSQGTSSYIVKGLGNKDSYCSCSHGAGRKMGRNEAKRTLNLLNEQHSMKGIINQMNNKNRLDEAPGAYKDIEKVMDNQKDLVEIVVKLNPLAVIKGN